MRSNKELLSGAVSRAQTHERTLRLRKSDYDLAASLRSAIFRLERNIRRQSRSMGRSAIELYVLQTLDQHPGSTQSELASLEQISKPSM